MGLRQFYDTIRYDMIRYDMVWHIYMCSKADEITSLVQCTAQKRK